MMLQWHHDLFWWESMHMCLVNWVGIVTLIWDAKVDAVITPFYERQNGRPRHIPWHIGKVSILSKAPIHWKYIGEVPICWKEVDKANIHCHMLARPLHIGNMLANFTKLPNIRHKFQDPHTLSRICTWQIDWRSSCIVKRHVQTHYLLKILAFTLEI